MASAGSINFTDIHSHLDVYGWAVVPNVLSLSDCDQYSAEIMEWVKQFGDGFPKNGGSIIHQYNIAHIAPAWKVRLQAKRVFAGLWETEKLYSSTDGISIGQPPELGVTSFDNIKPGANALHLDQGPGKVGLHAYQGGVYLEEALEDDWTFTVLEKSHKIHAEFFKDHKEGEEEFRKLANNEIQWYEDRECEVKRLTIPKGGMVLWDSRTVHAGAPPKRGRRNPRRWRYVVFVSMTPAIWATTNDIQEKQKGYNKLGISRHWSSSGFELFKDSPPHHFNITELPEEAKTDEAKRLCGVLDYDFGDGNSNGPGWKPIFA